MEVTPLKTLCFRGFLEGDWIFIGVHPVRSSRVRLDVKFRLGSLS